MTPDLPDVTKLKIISRYGIASCICMEAWLIGIVLFNYWFVSPSVDVSWFLVSLRAYDLGPAVYLFLQLAMKWSLVREEVGFEKRNVGAGCFNDVGEYGEKSVESGSCHFITGLNVVK
ncbi:hypothetical protein HDU79_007365 [Rhizoclosmatium sp. JEL0117]|nr:hypothetical protein HDU79_007365 [Rhizoclosmatium sp. JEL0117]